MGFFHWISLLKGTGATAENGSLTEGNKGRLCAKYVGLCLVHPRIFTCKVLADLIKWVDFLLVGDREVWVFPESWGPWQNGKSTKR